MTPADQLRAAAEKLRALATTASTDRYGQNTSTWTSHHVNDRDARLYGPDHVRIIRGGSSGPHGRGTHPHLAPAHADYIAAMDPSVGLALADWLDQAAHHYECGIRAADDVFHDDPAGHTAFLTTGPGAPSPQALTVARAILGGGQP